jgi:ABC-type sulfate transport system permease component
MSLLKQGFGAVAGIAAMLLAVGIGVLFVVRRRGGRR